MYSFVFFFFSHEITTAKFYGWIFHAQVGQQLNVIVHLPCHCAYIESWKFASLDSCGICSKCQVGWLAAFCCHLAFLFSVTWEKQNGPPIFFKLHSAHTIFFQTREWQYVDCCNLCYSKDQLNILFVLGLKQKSSTWKEQY